MKFVDGTRAYQILVLNHEGLVTAAVLLVQFHHEALVIGDGELRHREDRALALFAVQEQIILPLRAQNYATLVPGKKSERTVFTMAKFTIPDGKCLVVELNEKNGGRHQSFVIENEDLVRANTINELQVR